MKYFVLIILTVVLLGSNLESKAQQSDSLYLKSNFWGNKFFKGDTIYSINSVLEELAASEDPYNLMLNAKKDFVFAQILGATGGLLIGFPIGTSLTGGEPNWTMARIGVGIALISIPISINFKKKANQALREFNSSMVGKYNQKSNPHYSLGINGNGLNFLIRF